MSTAAPTTHLDAPPATPRGLALCLSGGGFRALLFHLGALRRLNELGILAKVDTFSSTSGGSLLAAHLATLLASDPGQRTAFTSEAWLERVESPLLTLALEGLAVGRARRLLPWNWFRPQAATEALAERLEKRLTPLRLRQLPAEPRFVFCATDPDAGVPWLYERDRVGDRQLGWAAPPDDVPLARAVAASACFPRSINPLPAPLDPAFFSGGAAQPGPARDAALRQLAVTDGSSHAHLGLEPVWTTHSVFLVSEAGAFQPRRRKRRPQPVSAVDTAGREIRSRRLVSGFENGTLSGTFWSISSAPSSYGSQFGYSKALARDVLSTLPTGLGPVSDAEAAILRNHGYLTADAALRAHTSGLLPRFVPGARVPAPAWSPVDPAIEERVREALARIGHGHRRTRA